MNLSPRAKFSVMMFLEFFIQGAWFPLASDYLKRLGFDSGKKAWIMNAFAMASITALFFSTQFADRNFAAEKFLAIQVKEIGQIDTERAALDVSLKHQSALAADAEGESKRMLAGIVFGVGMAIGAVNFMSWLFP